MASGVAAALAVFIGLRASQKYARQVRGTLAYQDAVMERLNASSTVLIGRLVEGPKEERLQMTPLQRRELFQATIQRISAAINRVAERGETSPTAGAKRMFPSDTFVFSRSLRQQPPENHEQLVFYAPGATRRAESICIIVALNDEFDGVHMGLSITGHVAMYTPDDITPYRRAEGSVKLYGGWRSEMTVTYSHSSTSSPNTPFGTSRTTGSTSQLRWSGRDESVPAVEQFRLWKETYPEAAEAYRIAMAGVTNLFTDYVRAVTAQNQHL